MISGHPNPELSSISYDSYSFTSNGHEKVFAINKKLTDFDKKQSKMQRKH